MGLRFRASPPHSHQSNGAVERLHRTLFDQLRAVRLQWAVSLGIQPERLPQQSLPWLLQHSVFILNKYLVKDTGTTAHQNNYHKAYNNPICQFGEAVLADIRTWSTTNYDRGILSRRSKAFGLARILLLMNI